MRPAAGSRYERLDQPAKLQGRCVRPSIELAESLVTVQRDFP
jgi:hypothetical protein